MHKVLFLLCLFTTTAQTATAQDDDQLIGGKFSYNQIKYTENLQEYTKLAVTLQPHYARFLSDRFMLTGDMGIDFNRVTAESLLSPGTNYFGITFTPGIRYYITDGKWKTFVYGAEQLAFQTQYSDAVGSVTISNFKQHPLVGAGVNRLIKPNLALDMIATYSPTADSLNLTVGIQAFIRKNAKPTTDSTKALPSVVAQGIQHVGGNIHGNISTKTGEYYFNFSPEYGFFYRKGLYLGIETSLYISGDQLSDSHTSLHLAPNIKYYFPVSKSFFLTGEGFAAIRVNQKTQNGLNLFAALGFSYFVTKDIALEFALIQYNKSFGSDNSGFPSGPALGFGFGIKSFIN
jgi:hypothetical protein